MKRFSLSLQHLVLRWILLVFDAIDDTTPLHAVYNIIMYYIQVDDLVRRMSDTLLVSVPDPNQPHAASLSVYTASNVWIVKIVKI